MTVGAAATAILMPQRDVRNGSERPSQPERAWVQSVRRGTRQQFLKLSKIR